MSDTKNITGRMRAAFVATPVGDDRWQAVLDVLHANGYRRCAEGQRTTQWCDRAEKAEAEVERLRADAERYRWLRNAQTGKAVNCVASSAFPAWLNGPELDAAIDAARGES